MYKTEKLRKPQSVAELGREFTAFHHAFGTDINRKGNLALIADNVIIYPLANSVVFHDIKSNNKRYLMAIEEAGIGCVAIHPSKTIFAVGGKGLNAKIFIYTYPDLNIIKVLEGGAERGYTSLNFSGKGTVLASVSSSPDYMLTVWNWEEERMGLHAKAFGQDVFGVRFSMDDERRLTSSGTGHIRFWKMAATFTGLKLQGHIGKFGKVELSDIAVFVELPDGKVVSGTESGALLLWEGNFIKCRFTQPGGVLCHNGEITYIELDRNERCLVTASLDGYIRWWDFFTIDSAEVDSDQSIDFELAFLAEYYIGDNRGVRNLIDSGIVDNERYYVVVDSMGILTSIRFSLNEEPSATGEDQDLPPAKDKKKIIGIPDNATVTVLSSFHAGAITGMDTSPIGHIAVTCGIDGTVRCWNYLERKFLGMSSFSVAPSVIRWNPLHQNHDGLTVTVGFSDGCVRVLTYTGEKEDSNSAFTLRMGIKPHNAMITDLSFSEDGSLLATSAKDGTIFLFNCDVLTETGSWTPLRFAKINSKSNQDSKNILYCDKINWNHSGDRLLCSCSDGIIREFDISDLRNELDANLQRPYLESYAFDFPVKEMTYLTTAVGLLKPTSPETSTFEQDISSQDMQNGEGNSPTIPPTDEVDLPQFVTAKVLQSIYYSDQSSSFHGILVGALGGTTSQLLECPLDSDVPRKELKLGLHSVDGKEFSKAPQITSMSYGYSKNFILIGTAQGTVIARPTSYVDTFLTVIASNNTCGGVAVAATSFDDNFILCAGKDGVLVVYRLNYNEALAAAEKIAAQLNSNSHLIDTVKPANDEKYEEPSYLSIRATNIYFADFPEVLDKTTLPIGRLPQVEEVEDIPSGSYSIEDAKLKVEDDGKKLLAEGKKEKVRSVVKALQREYDHIVQMNARLPKQVQLGAEYMMVDGEYISSLKRLGAERLDEVHKECAYEAEKARRLKEKLFDRLMDGVLVEEIPLAGFRKKRPIVVHSLRTRGMDPSLREVVDAVHATVRNDMLSDVRHRSTANSVMNKTNYFSEEGGNMLQRDDTNLDDTTRSSERKGGGSAAARREQRKLRKQNIEAHALLKPKEDEDDARDIRAIELAESTLGSYKLKCAEDYEVPESQRVNAEKKRRQMVLLEESMITMRLRFNERFLAMRQLKKQLVETIRKDNMRIREIGTELNQEMSEGLFHLTLQPDEFPDDRDEIAPNELEQYQEERKKKAWSNVDAPPNSLITGTKTTIKVDPDSGLYFVQPHDASNTTKAVSIYETIKDVNALEEQEINDCVLSTFASSLNRMNDLRKFSQMEDSIPILMFAKKSAARSVAGDTEARSKLERRRLLDFERRTLVKKHEENMNGFDLALEDLRQDRHVINADLKLAELKLLVLYQEYMLLLTFEGRDNSLQQKQQRCKREKSEIISSLSDCQHKLNLKSDDLADWNEKSAMVIAELNVLVPEVSQHADILVKIFKKKIKRSRKGADDQDEEDMEEEEDDQDDDDLEEEDVDDNCPPGCDVTLYEKVLDLREKRLDHEEYIAECVKTMDDLKKTMERLKQREKQIDKDSRQTEAEIQQFHLQKQTALNQIDIVVPLQFSQLFAFTCSGKLSGPTDRQLSEIDEYDMKRAYDEVKDSENRVLVSQMTLRSHVLFKTNALKRLHERISELHSETEGARTDLHALYKERVRLEKEREVQRGAIDHLTDRINELQMLKFGRLVDLDELEQGTDRSKEEDTSELIRKVEEKHIAISSKLLKEKEILKDKIAEATKQNTELLDSVAKLSSTKLDVTRELNSSSQVNSQQDSKLANYRDTEERQKIAAYVKLQHREIESIKNEITILRRKEPMATGTLMSMSMPITGNMPVPPSTVELMMEDTRGDNNGGERSDGKLGGGTGMFPPIPMRKGSSASAIPNSSNNASSGPHRHVEVNLSNKGGSSKMT